MVVFVVTVDNISFRSTARKSIRKCVYVAYDFVIKESTLYVTIRCDAQIFILSNSF